MSNALILIEGDGSGPRSASLSGITFGQQWCAHSGGEVVLGIIGPDAKDIADKVRAQGVSKVLVATGAGFEQHLSESYTTAVVAMAKAAGATLIAAGATSESKDLLPRVAARCDAAMASDAMAVIDKTTFKRPMWAGNVIATVSLKTEVMVATVRATEFDPPMAEANGSNAVANVEVIDVGVDVDTLKSRVLSRTPVVSERPDVTTADRVVSGGRGVKSADGFKLIEELADKLGAGVGATRAVCDAGWVPNDLQIGQTGKIVAPDLYIAVGISGAIQHLAGMKSSKVIVAINKDPEAPIFKVADYGLIADLFDAVPTLVKAL